jgi:hypothetical protein
MLTQLEIPYSHDEIFSAFVEVFTEIKEAANIDLSIPEDSKEVHESGGLKFFIDYVGPLGGRGDHVKMDISKGEKLEFDVENLKMYNHYSDIADEEEVTVQCDLCNSQGEIPEGLEEETTDETESIQ